MVTGVGKYLDGRAVEIDRADLGLRDFENGQFYVRRFTVGQTTHEVAVERCLVEWWPERDVRGDEDRMILREVLKIDPHSIEWATV